MKPQRIYMVIGTFHPFIGGAETQVLSMCRTLRERGHEATVITFLHNRTWPPREIIEGVAVIRVAGLLLGSRRHLPTVLQRLLYMLALVVMAWTLWRYRHHYDVVHLHQLTVLMLPVAIACRRAGKPLLVSIHSGGSGKREHDHTPVSLLAGPLDPTTPWLRTDGNSWVDGDLEGLLRAGRPFVRLARTLLQAIHPTLIILNSGMKGYLATHDFLLPDVYLIPNGVDTDRFCPGSGDIAAPERAHVVVCVSKLRYEKGIDVVLLAWHLVQQRLPQSRLILIGDGPIEKQLKCMATALGIQDSVEFAGLRQDVSVQLHRGCVAVLPSRWEGMPNAILEAMACGLPCVATRVSGSEDIVQHGINGLLVENEDYQDMAQALLLLLQDQVRIRIYAAAARKTIERHYSLARIIDRYIEIYQHLISSVGARFISPAGSSLPEIAMDIRKDRDQCVE
jgi:glycosyltransferase involved in cell wall biosynthesis